MKKEIKKNNQVVEIHIYIHEVNGDSCQSSARPKLPYNETGDINYPYYYPTIYYPYYYPYYPYYPII